jgi:putative colanic acid biosynthesis UDP-glucose lipid carrier transferase
MRTVAIAGAGPLSREIIDKLEETETYGVRIAGIYDDRSAERLAKEGDDTACLVGTLSNLIERARKGELDYIFIAMPLRAEKRIVELSNRLADTTASVYVIPDLFVFDLMRARWTTLGGLPAVSVYESPFDGLSGWIKRAEDLVLGTALLTIAAIPMIFVALGLKLTSPESIFFRQQRYGLNGRVVRVWKFRTMTVSEDGPNVVQARRHDPRITPFGRVLRATSLDELPQLFNVLCGEMSLVGPRPHAVVVNEQYRRLIHGYMLRHKVKPGITGWAQVNGWHGDDTVEKMQQRVDHDLAYLQNWSIWLDLKILLMTALAIVARRKRQEKAA